VPVFVHCQHGLRSNSTIVACLRIQHHRWSSVALPFVKPNSMGFSRFEYLMKRYVMEFGRPPNLTCDRLGRIEVAFALSQSRNTGYVGLIFLAGFWFPYQKSFWMHHLTLPTERGQS
jgi:hypothetical protein